MVGKRIALPSVIQFQLNAGWRRDAGVAQIFNLPYRRFSICTGWNARTRPGNPVADAGCKPAIRQIENLRYFQKPVRGGLGFPS
jgi:hypothetical protein